MFDSDFVRSLSLPISVGNVLNTLKRLKRLWPTTSPALPTGGFATILSSERDLGAWLDAHRQSRPTLTPGLSGFLPDAMCPLGTPESLRPILAATRTRLIRLRSAYADTLEPPDEQPGRAGECIGLRDEALKGLDEVDRLLQ